MFKDEKEFEEIVNRLNINTNPNSVHREKLKQQVLSAFNETSQKQTTPFGVFWRKIMKSPITKLAAAAVIIIGLLILFIYSSGNQNSQNSEDTYIVRQDSNDNEIETPETRGEYDDLMLAKQLFENKEIAGLSELLNSDFEAVKMQVAEYLGRIGDDTVLPELQILADQWIGSAQDNIYENAISAIEERLNESESESESESEEPQTQLTIAHEEPNEPEEMAQTGVTGIVIDKNTAKPIQGASLGFQKDELVLTDENGEFNLVVPIPWPEVPVDYSPEVPVYVTAANYASQRVVVHVEKDKMKEVTIELSPGSKLIGKVIDPNNQPIQGAEVCVLEYTTSIPVITDAEGKFEIDGVNPAYPSPRINVHHSLYPSVSIEFQPAPVGQSVYKEIVLKPGVIVFGQATDSNGEPVQGVTVGNTDSPLMWNVKKYETKEDGTYVLDNIDTDELTLWAVHDNYAPFVSRTTIDMNQPQKQIDIKLSDPSQLKGTVLDDTGNPVTRIFVVMSEYEGVRNIDNNRYPCKPDGSFVIPNAPKEGELTLNVFGQGITSKKHEVDFTLDEQLITVNKSGRIYGQVIDAATGKIIPKFHVRMTASRTGDKAYGYSVTWSEEGHTFNSPDGFFDTGRQDLPLGKQYRIRVGAEGYDPITNDLVPVQPVSDSPERTQFQLQPAKMRVGRVINIEGKPIEGATIIFYPNENVSYDEVLPRTITDKEGTYSILGLSSEYQIMEVNAPSYTPNVLLLKDISLPDSQFTDIILDHGVSLSGYVFDEKGTGIADVAISVYIDPARTNNVRTRLANVRYGATTDKNGSYQVQGVPSGKLLVIASNTQYYHRKKIEIKPTQTMQLNFGDEDGFIISGITTADKQQLDNTRVFLLSSEGEFLRRVIADSHGKFKFFYVGEDSYILKAAWSSNISSKPEKWPEGTNFEIERKLKIEENIELNIDMQAETVTDTQTGQVIKDD